MMIRRKSLLSTSLSTLAPLPSGRPPFTGRPSAINHMTYLHWRHPFRKMRSRTPFNPCRGTAPGPDGFTGLFFKECWEIIKHDLTAALNQLYNMNVQGFDLLNSANIFLLPKKMDAAKVGDYRPISLIHSIAKIFSKLLANILSSHLNTLVSKCQSAFIKHRCIQDNFLYIQNTVRRFHKMKMPALFMKLDIQKAFDTINWSCMTINWSYMLEVLHALGFGPRWR